MYLNIYIKDKISNRCFSKKVKAENWQEHNLLLINFLSEIMIEYSLYSDKLEIGTDYITEQEYFMK